MRESAEGDSAVAAVSTGDREALRAEIDALEWYHTIEIAPGVETPGWFDTRSVLSQIPFPDDLRSKRCLDVGTFDGFWAFEMERRGADDVVAIDVLDPDKWDWPVGRIRTSSPPSVGERLQDGASRSQNGSRLECHPPREECVRPRSRRGRWL